MNTVGEERDRWNFGIFALGLFAFSFLFIYLIRTGIRKISFFGRLRWHRLHLHLFGENNSGFSSTDGHFLRH